MKICLISDTHGSEHLLTLPEGDILIHCGDFHITNLNDLEYTNRWFAKQDFKYKIFVAGNHDTYIEKVGKDFTKSILKDVIYLENEGIEIEGLKFWGSPFSPEFNNWSFMYQRRSIEGRNIWNKMPEKLDLLITHAPPYKILDLNSRKENCGCEILQRKVLEKYPKYHCFGHLHESYGQEKIENTTFINCSLLDDNYDLVNEPIILEI